MIDTPSSLPWDRIRAGVECACGRCLWWITDDGKTHRRWVPPAGRETEPDLFEACTPGVSVPTTCPECRNHG